MGANENSQIDQIFFDYELPDGWSSKNLREVVSNKKGKLPRQLDENPWSGSIPHIDIDAFERGNVKRHSDRESAVIVQKGDLIVVWDGARCGLVGKAPFEGSLGSTLMTLKPLQINSNYLFFILRIYFKIINSNPRGIGIPHVEPDIFWNLEIPLPPLAEQQRIVVCIETLLSHINASRERLRRVPLIMKRFRQGVLAAACSGILTEEWREEQKNLESAAALYNRIHSIRLKKYEYTATEAKRLKKRLPPKPSYLENTEPDSDATTEIPNEWIWKKVVNLGPFGEDTVKTGPFGAILKSKEFVLSGVPIIAIGNVQWGKFDLNSARVDHVTEEKALELENYRVRTGDVLFTRSGTIGRSLVVPDFADHWLMSYHLLRVRADPNLIIPQYLYFVFSGCESSKEYTSDATIGSTRPGINTTILENVPIPLPPLHEQHEIVRRVNALFERADQIEQQVVGATKRTEALTHAVLRKAFSGELVR